MEINRNTMRADGITVGEAMDQDAAFLRSIGVDAKDGQPTLDEKIENYINKVRDAVLEALDSTTNSGKGWEDKDLTKLFEVIDAHAVTVFWRKHSQGLSDI